jgi:hypothetical protein
VGLRVLGEVLEMAFDLPQVDEALKDQILDNGKERKSAVDRILETMGVMSHEHFPVPSVEPPDSQNNDESSLVKYPKFGTSEYLQYGVHYYKKDECLRLHLKEAFPKFKRYADLYGFDGDMLDESSFKKQLQKEEYFVEHKSAQLGNSTRNLWFLNIKKMEEKGLDIPREWTFTPSEEWRDVKDEEDDVFK